MNIKSKDDLLMRIDNAIYALSDNEKYTETLGVLKDVRYEIDIYNFDESKEHLAEGLHKADEAHIMHGVIAELLIAIYLDGIENGDADSMCNLGALYYTGRAGVQDYDKAAKYYHMADKAGNSQATENLGYIYYYGRTGEPDYKKAFNYFVKGAVIGKLRSLYKIGDFYKNGYYVEKDPKEAFRIYDHCVDMLSDESIPEVGADVYMRMGDCFYKGFGVEKDLLIALRFMNTAENLFYSRLMDGDFYQKSNLNHVLEVESAIRKEIGEELIPDLSWAKYNG